MGSELSSCTKFQVAPPPPPHGSADKILMFTPEELIKEVILLIDFSLTVKAAALIFISGRGSAISSAKQGKSGSFYNLVKN